MPLVRCNETRPDRVPLMEGRVTTAEALSLNAEHKGSSFWTRFYVTGNTAVCFLWEPINESRNTL